MASTMKMMICGKIFIITAIEVQGKAKRTKAVSFQHHLMHPYVVPERRMFLRFLVRRTRRYEDE